MSGIVAIKGTQAYKDTMVKMLDKLKHRGPQKQNIFPSYASNVLIGECNLEYELSKIDESQNPIDNKNHNINLALDGEPLMEGKRLSRNDLIKLFQREGPEFVKFLGDGFALIYTDGKELYAARDIFGRRPLYYGHDSSNNIYFASEMKALTEICEEIKIFPPGYYYSQDDGFNKYTSIPHFESNIDEEPGSKDYYEKSARLKYLLIKAVADSWETGKEPGIFLSGGVDSSVVAAALANLTDKPIHTFAVGIEDSEDIKNAEEVSQYLGTEHTVLTYTEEDMFEVLPEVIYYLESFDVELVNSSIANYLVSKLAKSNNFEITLSGEGADELFGGYHHLKDCKSDEQLNEALEGLLKGLHNGGLQRVDRMTNAHSLNCRMPFLHSYIINYALKIPCDWKISGNGMEKLILRQAFDGDLPEQVLWRKKAQFGIGSGNEKAMEKIIDSEITDQEYYDNKEKHGIDFKSKEEYFYFKIFHKFFPEKSQTKTVNRWLV
ncbi:asparagine synthase-related protein [Natranaerobius thermophilus]|uniref:asparagine synthase (glutamine-hydrolyzing) n=1 Tax=Natranaerobius thermophilus (strain ATCC BAA-1301 / DSM 18059 / JW/NM-WN-LF) TaxID=457570 RepID=B2A623_NATTJ|nr:asparagine synthase-related protein [Natranaerobius thermophilus]ACB85440.1 asparagine synthase [Natranaerobius thermophilus JW/NM-WN-LF]